MTTHDDNDALIFPSISVRSGNLSPWTLSNSFNFKVEPEPDVYLAPFEDTSTICSTDADLFFGSRSRTDRLLPRLPLTSDTTSPLSPSPFPSINSHSFWEFPFPSIRTRKQSISVSSIQSQGSYSSQPLFGFVSERKMAGVRRPPLLSSTTSASSTSTTDSLQTKVGVDVDVKIIVPKEVKTAVPLKTRSSLKSKDSPGKKKQCCVKFVEAPIIYYEQGYERDAREVSEDDLVKPIPPPKSKHTASTDTQKATTHIGLTNLKGLVKGSLKKRSSERDRREPQNLGRERQAMPVVRPAVDVEPVNDPTRRRISGPYPMSAAVRQRRTASSESKATCSTGGNGFRSFLGRLIHPA